MKKTTLALAFLLLVLFAAGAKAEEKAISKENQEVVNAAEATDP